MPLTKILDTSSSSIATIFDLMIVNRFIVEENIKRKAEIIKKFPHLIVYPFRWNFFHLLSKFFSNRELIISCVESRIPLLIDSYEHTPFHYLLNKRNIDFGLVNGLLENFSNIIQQLPPKQKYLIVKSITLDLPAILKLNTPQVAQFLKIGIGRPQSYGDQEIPHFGRLKNNAKRRFLFSTYNTFGPEVSGALLNEEDEENVVSKPLISVWVISFHLNYSPRSKDMLAMIKSLDRVSNEDIFKTQSISIIVQYLWGQNKLFHYTLTAIFSALMILFSYYTAVGKRNMAMEIILLALGVLFLLYELFVMSVTTFKVYSTQIWNYLDIIFNSLLIATIALNWSGSTTYVRRWITSLALFFGYIKWISFFRVIDQTRN